MQRMAPHWVTPDGTSGKADYDKVNNLLEALTAPLNAEMHARFDQSIEDGSNPSVAYNAEYQMLTGWREQAWRNAEALLNAPTPAARALVAQQIEESSTAEAKALLAAYAYTPPLSSTTARDNYCPAHNGEKPPIPYDFGTPSAY